MSTKTDSNAYSGHRKRLRERLECEPQSVADYEILELLLGLALTRKDTKPLAYALLKKFGNMRGVLDARPDELEEIEGIGTGVCALWRLVRELMTRYHLAPLLEKTVLANPETVVAVARARIGNLPHEESWLALVDAQNRLISWQRLRKGSVSSIAIQPRDILEVALKYKASGIILVHNHPGGSPQPSRPDMELTHTLQQLAPQLGLRLLDHVIITTGKCYSIISKTYIRPTEVG